MLSKEKLLLLAEVLQVPRDKLLAAAGYSPSEDTAIGLSRVLLGRCPAVRRLKVVTDPRFIDSAVFMWIFSTQPFSSIGVDCELFRTDWRSVPDGIASEKEYAIGFFNRRVVEPGLQSILEYWTDLCIYKGYALLARPGTGPQTGMTLSHAKKYLETLCSEHGTPVIITMGADTVWRLTTPLTPILEKGKQRFKVKDYGNADLALRQFLEGEGHLFVGGLSQRLVARERGCIEILSFNNNPLLFSLNSLICTQKVVEEQKPLLAAVVSLWFETVAALQNDIEFCKRVARASIKLIESMGLRDHSLQEDFFTKVFMSEKGAYESFPIHPADLMDQLRDILTRVVKTSIKDKYSKQILNEFSGALSRIGPESI